MAIQSMPVQLYLDNLPPELQTPIREAIEDVLVQAWSGGDYAPEAAYLVNFWTDCPDQVQSQYPLPEDEVVASYPPEAREECRRIHAGVLAADGHAEIESLAEAWFLLPRAGDTC